MFKVVLKSLLILPLVASSAFACESHTYEAVIKRVVDGDTVRADIVLGLGVVLSDQVVRLYGLDAPEIRGKERAAGLRAKAFVEEELKNAGRVTIRIEPSWGRDKYGRRLGVINTSRGVLNEILIESGLADRVGY